MRKHALQVRLENWLREKTDFFSRNKKTPDWRTAKTWGQVSCELHVRREQLREELLTVMELCEHAAVAKREAEFLGAKNKATALRRLAQEMQLLAEAEQDWRAALARQIVEKPVASHEKTTKLNAQVQALSPEIAGWEDAYDEWQDN